MDGRFLFLSLSLIMGLCSSASAQTFEQAPGTAIQIDLDALPEPFNPTPPANHASPLTRPAGTTLTVPDGFTATLFAEGLTHARNMVVAPNGDVFLAESTPGRITLLRDNTSDGSADLITTFAQGFDRPFGLAFSSTHLYVGDTEAVWRIPYSAGDTFAAGPAEQVTADGALGPGSGHWTRNVALHPDGTHIYVAIGSQSNIAVEDEPRATVQEFQIDGSGQRTFATGLRNPVGLAFRPGTADLYTVVNERDGLHDELVPDYMTRVQDGGFYGWPYSFMGQNIQPNIAAAPAGLVESAVVPDTPLRSHSAPIGLAFYDATQFPIAYQSGAFVALHGSWNAAQPRGYKVVYVPFIDGAAADYYTVFASGFWISGEETARVWGRPAGVAVASDGALLISDDVGQTIWRVESAEAGRIVNSVVASPATTFGSSFLRIYNGTSDEGAVTVTLRDGDTGASLTTWISDTIPPNASLQFDVMTLEQEGEPALGPDNSSTAYNVEIQSTFTGFIQHVLWNADAAVLENMSRCAGGLSANDTVAINVHSSAITGYPSSIRIHNDGTGTLPAELILYDATDGTEMARWTSTDIAVGGSLEVSVADIEAATTPPLTGITVPSHFNVALENGFVGHLQHIVRSTETNALSELTDKCDLTGDS